MEKVSVMISEEEIDKRVRELGKQITEDYQEEELLVIGCLKGSVVFLADLVRRIDLPVTLDFMSVSSYGSGTVSSGKIDIKKDLDTDINGKNVLIVEDIIDTGNTLSHLYELLLSRGPKSLKIATLLNKPSRRVSQIKADYVGFVIPDEFVVGFGLDYDQRYRALPYVGVVSFED